MTDETTSGYDDAPENVVPLGREPEPVAAETPRPHGGLHGTAIAGLAICALVGIASMLAFITVSWPGETGRYVIGIFIGAAVGFMTCASLAVFSAARDTYTVRDARDGTDD